MSNVSELLAGISSADVTHEQIRIRGLDIHVQLQGEGPALLLYSGIFGEVDLWKPVLPYLVGFRTIAFDPPGIGRSQLPKLPMNMFQLAELGTQVLDHFGEKKAHVLGGSFGGAVAQQMALMHPHHVDRLVLVSTSFGGFALPGDLRSFYHFSNPASYRPGRAERVAGPMFGGRLREEPELLNTLHVSRPASMRHFLYRSSALYAWTSLPWMWAIRKQTLILAGDDDPVTPLSNHKIMAKLIPHARLQIIPGGGHLMLMDSPERVGPHVVRFLREGHPGPAGSAGPVSSTGPTVTPAELRAVPHPEDGPTGP